MHIELLKQLNQTQIIEKYNSSSADEQQKFDAQVSRLNTTYPGGIKAYHQNALKLLKESAEGANPYADYKVGLPHGVIVNLENEEQLSNYQSDGMKEFQNTCFVLVAGGLGERLGFPGIKISIPMELVTEKTFIQYYVQYLLAFQTKYCPKGHKIQLAIMTSDDTHEKTEALISQNNFFGLEKEQITYIKQEKVPALIDNEAHFSLVKEKLEIETKPHGHGDVHTLLYTSGLAQKWNKEGNKWIIVFQDTNPFAFKSFAALLGVSAQRNLDFNTIAVPRKPGEAVGAITTLMHKDSGKELTINVQYNQLEPLFKESGGQKSDENGFSLFPGNTNCFCIKISSYIDVLQKTKGLISEFINPKYTDSTKTKFKSSTRLECLMQDYPKLLPSCEKVTFTDFPKLYCFTTAKNDLQSSITKLKSGLSGESAGTCESDIYASNRMLLKLCGAEIEDHDHHDIAGFPLPFYPMISISPFFATCLTEMRKKIKKLKVSTRSSLAILSDCQLEDVDIDGHYEIKENGSINLKYEQKKYTQLVDTKGHEHHNLLVRGYKVKDKHQ